MMSKFNCFEIATQSARKSERKNIFNARIVLKCQSFWGFKAGPKHWLIYAHFVLQLLYYVGKILEFLSELPNPNNDETIQNSLNYWNRKEGLLIWTIVERINFLLK